MRRILFVALAFLCAAGAKTFTLEQVLSAPFPSELIAAPDGNKVAWVLNESGARNVWVATALDFKGVRVTAYTADDGQLTQKLISSRGNYKRAKTSAS
jgi:hypothetical protein